jgi:hypothetical protein
MFRADVIAPTTKAVGCLPFLPTTKAVGCLPFLPTTKAVGSKCNYLITNSFSRWREMACYGFTRWRKNDEKPVGV